MLLRSKGSTVSNMMLQSIVGIVEAANANHFDKGAPPSLTSLNEGKCYEGKFQAAGNLKWDLPPAAPSAARSRNIPWYSSCSNWHTSAPCAWQSTAPGRMSLLLTQLTPPPYLQQIDNTSDSAPSNSPNIHNIMKKRISKHGEADIFVLHGKDGEDFTRAKYQKQNDTLMPHLDALQA